ncbi:MAG: riboflavin synthase [Bryobacteraceae bacterium]
MFTGIIEATGTVESCVAGRLRVHCGPMLDDAKLGASIAVNGVCLTAVELGSGTFSADLAPETLARTNLGDLKPGDLVNLERPLAAGGRLDGHIVQGHVDGTGAVTALDALGDGNWWLRVRVPPELERYLVYKGSVALDGISLTVARAEPGEIAVTIIPHTYARTNLQRRLAGDRINIECDVLAKYVEKMLAARG